MTSAVLMVLVLSQESVVHSDPKFSFRIPAGYTRIETPANLAYRFAKEPPTRVDPRFFILVEISPIMLPEGPLPGAREGIEEQVRATFGQTATASVNVKTIRWRDLDIQAIEIRTHNKTGNFLSLQAFVPLYPKGIRLEVVGLERYQSDIYSDFSEVVSHLEGIPSWTSPAQEQLMRRIPLLTAASFFSAPFYVLAWFIFLRKKPRRLGMTRTLWMFAMAALALASPVLWKVFLYGQTPTPAPGVCTWPIALFLAAPWFMLGTARLGAQMMSRGTAQHNPEPGSPA